MKLAYADDVKQLILNSPNFFIKPDEEASVLFEKQIDGLSRQVTVADCLIFTHSKGLIGVEIKSAHDSKARLRRQLRGYSKVCDTVYVFIHDSILPEIEDILDEFPYVGCICYTEVEGFLSPGLVREASLNPNKDFRTELDMMWSVELWKLVKEIAKIKHVKPPLKKSVNTKRKLISYIVSHDKGKAFIDFVLANGFSKDRYFSIYDFKREAK